MMATLTWIARSLFNTLDNIATPCSVNALGGFRCPILSPELEVTICDFHSRVSSGVSLNIKSLGKRLAWRFTA